MVTDTMIQKAEDNMEYAGDIKTTYLKTKSVNDMMTTARANLMMQNI